MPGHTKNPPPQLRSGMDIHGAGANPRIVPTGKANPSDKHAPVHGAHFKPSYRHDVGVKKPGGHRTVPGPNHSQLQGNLMHGIGPYLVIGVVAFAVVLTFNESLRARLSI